LGHVSLAAYTNAATIHFTDYPSLAAYTCHDGHHLDCHDAVRFTHALCDILKQKLRAS
jgi:hypothetical protein